MPSAGVVRVQSDNEQDALHSAGTVENPLQAVLKDMERIRSQVEEERTHRLSAEKRVAQLRAASREEHAVWAAMIQEAHEGAVAARVEIRKLQEELALCRVRETLCEQETSEKHKGEQLWKKDADTWRTWAGELEQCVAAQAQERASVGSARKEVLKQGLVNALEAEVKKQQEQIAALQRQYDEQQTALQRAEKERTACESEAEDLRAKLASKQLQSRMLRRSSVSLSDEGLLSPRSVKSEEEQEAERQRRKSAQEARVTSAAGQHESSSTGAQVGSHMQLTNAEEMRDKEELETRLSSKKPARPRSGSAFMRVEADGDGENGQKEEPEERSRASSSAEGSHPAALLSVDDGGNRERSNSDLGAVKRRRGSFDKRHLFRKAVRQHAEEKAHGEEEVVSGSENRRVEERAVRRSVAQVYTASVVEEALWNQVRELKESRVLESALDRKHVWEEFERDDEDKVADMEVVLGELHYGSVNRIVEFVTCDGREGQVAVMLVALRDVLKPCELLLKLAQRCQVPEENDVAVQEAIQGHVVHALRQWFHAYPDDFDESLRASAVSLLTSLSDRVPGRDEMTEEFNAIRKGESGVSENGTVSTVASSSSSSSSTSSTDDTSGVQVQAPEPIVPKNVFSPSLVWEDVDEVELARQITLDDWEVYSSIKETELQKQAWSKEKYRHLAPNVLLMTSRSNGLSAWVEHMVLQEESLKDRSARLSKILRLLESFLDLHNYHAAMAVHAGLTSQAVDRLKHTKSELKKHDNKVLARSAELCHPNKNFKAFREALNESLEAGVAVMPFLGFLLTDLTFIEDGNADTRDGLINFRKKSMVHGIVALVARSQRVPFVFVRVPQISKLVELERLLEVCVLDEDAKYEVSLRLEPRGSDKGSLA